MSEAREIFVALSSSALFESSVCEAFRVDEIMSDQLNEVRSALLKVADRLSALQKATPQGK